MPAKEPWSPAEYEEAARVYMRGLPLEHFAESVGQGRQREITLASLSLLEARRPDVQVFNELLVQYPHGRRRQVRQVVPDNMVVVHLEPIRAYLSYDLPFQPVAPFWVLNYVSPHPRRKDYAADFRRYETELKVPYALVCYPQQQNMMLYRHAGKKYVAVAATPTGRYAIPELGLEMGLQEGWVRFWYEGELLLLPAEMQRERDEALARIQKAREETKRHRQRFRRFRARLLELGIEPPE
jgi:Uma2 family endonuclease